MHARKKEREKASLDERDKRETPSLLYIYSNGIIPAVLAPGRGASFAVITRRLYPGRDTIRLSPSLAICSLISPVRVVFSLCVRSLLVVIEEGGRTARRVNDLRCRVCGLSDLNY